MEVTPQTLPSLDPNSSWHSNTTYTWKESIPGYEIYGAYRSSGFETSHEIKVDTVTNIWTDYGSAHPYNAPSLSNGVITLSDPANSNLYKFTKPTTASWISGGGGTGSSGSVSLFSATFNPNTTSELRAVITRQGPAQYEGGTPHIYLFDENVYLNNPLYTTNWPTGGTTTSQTFSSLYNFTLDDTKTYYIGSAQGIIYATSTPESRRPKKVFCNFW